MEKIRILFVDDEPGILFTLPMILQQQGYAVTAVGTVPEALAQIATAQFDVLISDLNIGHAGDGFTVVSAMRRTQPECITLILTGYPGFDTALEAIRNQVDDYLVKPAPVPTLIHLIEEKLQGPKPGTAVATKRISQLLRENVGEVTQHVLKEMTTDPALRALPITEEQRTEFIPCRLEDLAKMLDSTPDSAESEQAAQETIYNAKLRGIQRHQQGFTIPLMVRHTRIIEQAIYDVVHEHLLSLNLSYFMTDLKRLNADLNLQLEHALLAYLEMEEQVGRQAGQQQP